MMRLIAFFYHLSLSITFTVWTELLLDDFGNDFSKASDFLGCVGRWRGFHVCVVDNNILSGAVLAVLYSPFLCPSVWIYIDVNMRAFPHTHTPQKQFTKQPYSICNGVERAIQFLSAPFLGNLSDCLGRQPVMIVSLLLYLLALLIVILKPVGGWIACMYASQSRVIGCQRAQPYHQASPPLPTAHHHTKPTHFQQPQQSAKTILAYFLINGISNVTWAMLNAIVADLSAGRDGDQGALTQQYGRLGAWWWWY